MTRMRAAGKDGLKGYLRWASMYRANAFIAQLGRVMPLQVNVKSEKKVEIRYETVEEVRVALRAKGIDPDVLDAGPAAEKHGLRLFRSVDL
jgi:hypothetical protein